MFIWYCFIQKKLEAEFVNLFHQIRLHIILFLYLQGNQFFTLENSANLIDKSLFRNWIVVLNLFHNLIFRCQRFSIIGININIKLNEKFNWYFRFFTAHFKNLILKIIMFPDCFWFIYILLKLLIWVFCAIYFLFIKIIKKIDLFFMILLT